MAEEIKNLEEILLPEYLGKNRKIVQCNVKRLTAAGENYGSLMLAVDITVKDNDSGQEDILKLVAKAVPPNEFIQKMFKTPLTFKKELEFYRTVVPTLRQFQRDEGVDHVIDFFPEYYGGRLGLGSNFDSFDSNAVILLENLKIKDFVCADRTKGFDLETAKFILNDLATLHALPIALKLKRPEVFNEKILPYLNDVKVFDGLKEETMHHVMNEIIGFAAEIPECLPLLDRLKTAIVNNKEYLVCSGPPREPFATFVHNDFWVNNTMNKIKNNKVISNKVVDFQMTLYGSPVRDLIFFIFDSVQNGTVEEHLDHLITFYHQRFVDTLDKYQVDTKTFSSDELKKEIDIEAKKVLFQCIIMLKPILAKSGVKEVEDLSENDFTEKSEIPQGYLEKFSLIVKEFAKKNWI